MSATKLINVQGKGPVTQTRSGRFEVSIWHWKKVVPAKEAVRDFFPEREFDVHRACVQHSWLNRSTQTWEEDRIWCSIEDLRNLAEALDDILNPED